MQVVRDSNSLDDNIILSNGTFVNTSSEQSFWTCAQSSGKICRFDGNSIECIPDAQYSTRGSPSGVAVDEAGRVYLSDVDHGAILKLDESNGTCVPIVEDYEGKRLLGPSSIAFGGDETMFFTDSGPLGESSIDDPCGSVFAITRDETGQILKPLALRVLAHPCGVCVSPINDNIIYVAETLKNRVLRFCRRPHGAFISSVLHQFSGALGPNAIACDPENGHLFVSRFDFDGSHAVVSEIDPSGAAGGHVRDIEIPQLEGSQITGLAFNEETRELYIFESTSAKVVKLRI